MPQPFSPSGALRDTEIAILGGVCGSPWIEVDGEAFFGSDRLLQIAWRLSGT